MDVLRIFLRDVGRIPRVSPSEELRLAKLAKAGDVSARNQLIAANLRLAISVAKRFYSKRVAPEDLIQAANLGLMRAVELFDPYKLKPDGNPYKFSTYASWWLRQLVRAEVWVQRSVIRIPKHRHKQHSGLHPDAERALNTQSIGSREEETIGVDWNPAVELEHAECLNLEAAKLRRGLETLSDRERYVVLGRFSGKKLQTIGDQLEVTRERIRQIEEKALNKLRQFYQEAA